MEIAPKIVVDEKIRFGKPVIKGTGVPFYLILGKLAGGMTYEEVMEEYEISREDIMAVLDYASKILSSEESILKNKDKIKLLPKHKAGKILSDLRRDKR